MNLKEPSISAASFAGQWIGQTQGQKTLAHLWEIRQIGLYLAISTRWEGETSLNYFHAQMVQNEPAFRIPNADNAKAILISKYHFVIPEWCWDLVERPDGIKVKHDVVFARPGIAELTARSVYLKNFKNPQPPDDN